MCYLRNFPAINESLPSKDEFFSKFEESSTENYICSQDN